MEHIKAKLSDPYPNITWAIYKLLKCLWIIKKKSLPKPENNLQGEFAKFVLNKIVKNLHTIWQLTPIGTPHQKLHTFQGISWNNRSTNRNNKRRESNYMWTWSLQYQTCIQMPGCALRDPNQNSQIISQTRPIHSRLETSNSQIFN